MTIYSFYAMIQLNPFVCLFVFICSFFSYYPFFFRKSWLPKYKGLSWESVTIKNSVAGLVRHVLNSGLFKTIVFFAWLSMHSLFQNITQEIRLVCALESHPELGPPGLWRRVWILKACIDHWLDQLQMAASEIHIQKSRASHALFPMTAACHI